MTTEPPRLGVLSDEIDRLRDYLDVRLREERMHNDLRQEETKERLKEQTALVAQQAAATVKSIDAMNATIAVHNGRLSKVEKALAYMDGLKAGAGGSWHLLVGAIGVIGGLGGLAIAILTVAQHVVK